MLAIGDVVGASNAFNQVIEKDLDALMDRTKTVQFLREECLLFSIGCCERTYYSRDYICRLTLKQQCLVRFYISIHQRLYSVKNGHIIICFVGAFPELFRLC
jgi:hypothetical protein